MNVYFLCERDREVSKAYLPTYKLTYLPDITAVSLGTGSRKASWGTCGGKDLLTSVEHTCRTRGHVTLTSAIRQVGRQASAPPTYSTIICLNVTPSKDKSRANISCRCVVKMPLKETASDLIDVKLSKGKFRENMPVVHVCCVPDMPPKCVILTRTNI